MEIGTLAESILVKISEVIIFPLLTRFTLRSALETAAGTSARLITQQLKRTTFRPITRRVLGQGTVLWTTAWMNVVRKLFHIVRANVANLAWYTVAHIVEIIICTRAMTAHARKFVWRSGKMTWTTAKTYSAFMTRMLTTSQVAAVRAHAPVKNVLRRWEIILARRPVRRGFKVTWTTAKTCIARMLTMSQAEAMGACATAKVFARHWGAIPVKRLALWGFEVARTTEKTCSAFIDHTLIATHAAAVAAHSMTQACFRRWGILLLAAALSLCLVIAGRAIVQRRKRLILAAMGTVKMTKEIYMQLRREAALATAKQRYAIKTQSSNGQEEGIKEVDEVQRPLDTYVSLSVVDDLRWTPPLESDAGATATVELNPAVAADDGRFYEVFPVALPNDNNDAGEMDVPFLGPDNDTRIVSPTHRNTVSANIPEAIPSLEESQEGLDAVLVPLPIDNGEHWDEAIPVYEPGEVEASDEEERAPELPSVLVDSTSGLQGRSYDSDTIALPGGDTAGRDRSTMALVEEDYEDLGKAPPRSAPREGDGRQRILASVSMGPAFTVQDRTYYTGTIALPEDDSIEEEKGGDEQLVPMVLFEDNGEDFGEAHPVSEPRDGSDKHDEAVFVSRPERSDEGQVVPLWVEGLEDEEGKCDPAQTAGPSQAAKIAPAASPFLFSHDLSMSMLNLRL
ncbi:hypothetical protein D9615_010505 [Tricholomella constricta]|uniref:Uncharacterized protein n=1 Tax=Tricholomella constricta TaxID=117010 RepID=A0A8H5LSD1_9AGAR|nr:hypothetical protein D9615_010505 [Tricholomella constricta]